MTYTLPFTQEEIDEWKDAVIVLLDSAPSHHELFPNEVPYIPSDKPINLMETEVF